jgi:hypothetical protein
MLIPGMLDTVPYGMILVAIGIGIEFAKAFSNNIYTVQAAESPTYCERLPIYNQESMKRMC